MLLCRAGLSISEALGKLSIEGPHMLSNLACVKMYDPFIGVFQLCKQHGTAWSYLAVLSWLLFLQLNLQLYPGFAHQ